MRMSKTFSDSQFAQLIGFLRNCLQFEAEPGETR